AALPFQSNLGGLDQKLQIDSSEAVEGGTFGIHVKSLRQTTLQRFLSDECGDLTSGIFMPPQREGTFKILLTVVPSSVGFRIVLNPCPRLCQLRTNGFESRFGDRVKPLCFVFLQYLTSSVGDDVRDGFIA